jgi:hypothetical protein
LAAAITKNLFGIPNSPPDRRGSTISNRQSMLVVMTGRGFNSVTEKQSAASQFVS